MCFGELTPGRFEQNKANMKASCANWGVADDSDTEIDNLKSAIVRVAGITGIDARFILAIVMQESTGCVRVSKYTADGCFEVMYAHATNSHHLLRPPQSRPHAVVGRQRNLQSQPSASGFRRHIRKQRDHAMPVLGDLSDDHGRNQWHCGAGFGSATEPRSATAPGRCWVLPDGEDLQRRICVVSGQPEQSPGWMLHELLCQRHCEPADRMGKQCCAGVFLLAGLIGVGRMSLLTILWNMSSVRGMM
jgi:hypothetical protein